MSNTNTPQQPAPLGKPATLDFKPGFWIEFDDQDIMKFVRPHRSAMGTLPKTAFRVSLGCEPEEELFGFLSEAEEAVGRSEKMPQYSNLILTFEPHLYGDPDDRKADGKTEIKHLNFGEWNLINEL